LSHQREPRFFNQPIPSALCALPDTMADLNSWEDDPAAQDENLSRQAQQQLNVNQQNAAAAQGAFRPGVASFQPGAQSFQPGQPYGGGFAPQYQQQQYYQQGYYPQYGQQQGFSQYNQSYGGGFSQGYNQGYGERLSIKYTDLNLHADVGAQALDILSMGSRTSKLRSPSKLRLRKPPLRRPRRRPLPTAPPLPRPSRSPC